MKKALLLSALIIILIIAGYIIYQALQPEEADNRLSDKEMEFNQSGRAKAVENETDLWQYYENKQAGFSLNYPHDVILGIENMNQNGEEYYLSIQVEPVDSLVGTMGYNQETAIQNIISLEKGDYGQRVDFPVDNSTKVRSLGKVNAQEFAVLSRFEVCNVVFERKLYFFSNNHQVVITLFGPKETFAKSLSSYLVLNVENCGQQKVWDIENNRLELFYRHMESGKMSDSIQRWYFVFDKIVNTIKFFNAENELDNFDALQGRWMSVDDQDSIVEFKENKKIDFYADQKMSESNFAIYSSQETNQSDIQDKNGKYLIVDIDDEKMKYEIVEVTNNSLTLIYLDRGNILKYKRIFE